MDNQYDFKSEWEKTKKQLIKFSKEAVETVKKGEKELIKFSQKSKVHIDATAVSLKKEKLFYLIGKECVKIKMPEKLTPKLQKLLEEYKKIDKQQKALQGKIKSAKK